MASWPKGKTETQGIRVYGVRLRLKCDGTSAETRFRLSGKRTTPFKSAVASVQSTADSRGVRISGSNVGYTMFRGSVKSTGYPLHLPVSPSLPLPCVTVCHHISTGLYHLSCPIKPLSLPGTIPGSYCLSGWRPAVTTFPTTDRFSLNFGHGSELSYSRLHISWLSSAPPGKDPDSTSN
jgi:hypothetical protein